MAVDRAGCLRDAEKFLRQNRLDLAIGEYRRVVEAYPTDWNTANALGDLYVRTHEPGLAIEQFARIAEGLCVQGFLPKAAAVYKKVLKIRPDDEHALLRAGEIAGQQGLLADAKAYLAIVADRRRNRGDIPGVEEIDRLLTSLDPDAIESRREKARAGLRRGDVLASIRELKMLAAELSGKDRRMDALHVMLEALAYAPDDRDLQLALIEVRLREGNLDTAMSMTRALLDADPGRWLQSARLSSALMRDVPHAAALFAVLIAEHLAHRGEWDAAASVVQDLRHQAPTHDISKLEAAIARRSFIDDPPAPNLETAPAELSAAEELHHPPQAPPPSSPQPQPPTARPTPAQIELLDDEDGAIVPTMNGDEEPHPDDVDLSASLDDVFADMRAEASKQLMTDAADQAFATGAELTSSGQIEQAMAAFEIAAASPRRRFDAASRLARMHRQRGNLTVAIEWFERAAEATAPSPEAGYRVLYELAGALETSGEPSRALACYFELQSEAGDYEDVAERVERLMSQPGG